MGSEGFLDALVVGAGFSGVHTLWKLRRLGFSVKIYETGSDLGGTWFWNRYPGARVDSETPLYQLSEAKEAWIDFEWQERFPGREEIQRYFHHADKKLDLSKDIVYNTRVTSADFDDSRNLWLVKTDTGLNTWARQLILCIGFSAKLYTPPFQGIEIFKGQWLHSALWPEEGIDLKGKRVAIIGTGATGVQIIQEIGPEVGHLTVYQRTPNLALPMRQCFLKDEDKQAWKFPKVEEYEGLFEKSLTTFAAVTNLDANEKKFQDTTRQERQALYEFLWSYGGFGLWLGGYMELFFVQEANDEAYEFWSENIRPRIKDPHKKDLLAPKIAPHAFGTKRPCLEQAYYEVYNQDNIDLINVRESPIIEITETGVRTEKEGVIDVDVIISATGFDSITGGLLNIQITNGQKETIQEKWSEGVSTYLGMTTSGFPNLHIFYGPQAPTAFCNGPTCGPLQSDFLADLMLKMREDNKVRVEATKQAEDDWVKQVKDIWYSSLLPATDSWYQGANIPGKIREPLSYLGGLPAYILALKNCKENNYDGYIIG